MVQKAAHGQGSPFIPGFTGFRSLFLIDGVRLNNSVFRDGSNQDWTTVDALGLERVEVVKGPVSVLGGSDAVGWTVNALTEPVPAGDLDPSRRLVAGGQRVEIDVVAIIDYTFWVARRALP